VIGQTLGHHRILEKIGAGGMGVVYRAHDPRLGRDVAIKVLAEPFARDPERLARFEREARVLAALNHPNIAAIYGFEQAGDVPFVVLEYVPGRTLAELGRLETPEALRVAAQIAEALEAAHEKAIAHRDLKPANVKVTPEGKVKVLDFGLAKVFADELPSDPLRSPTQSLETRAGVIMGTAAYMSPEQARSGPLDKRTDVWSFGCVLYEMLAGRRAFGGDNISDILANVLRGDPDWTALPSDTPASIQVLLHRCLEKALERRLRDMGDARLEIQDALAGPSPRAPASQPRPGRRVAWVAAALLAAITTGLGVWRLSRAPTPAPQPVSRFTLPLPPAAPLALAGLAISPDGARVAYVAGRGATALLYVHPLDQPAAKPLPGTEGAVGPFFSPDGQWVGFFAQGKVKKVAVAGGDPIAICDTGPTVPSGAGSWGPDDTIVFSGGLNIGLLQVAAAGGAPKALTTTQKGENLHLTPEILPGGKGVLFTAWLGNEEVSSISLLLPSGERRVLIQRGLQPRYAPTGHLVFMRAGNLLAAPFDLRRLEVTGPPQTVLEGVLQSNTGGQLAFSATGSMLYAPGFSRPANRKLAWMDRRGALSPLPLPPRSYWFPRISHDGQRLMLTIREANIDVWSLDLARGGLARLTFEEGEDETGLLSPDGKRVAYSSTRSGQPRLVSWRLADGAGEEERLWTSPHHIHLSSWSRDGRTIAFETAHPTSRWDIWVLPLDGERKARPFLATPFSEQGAYFSPDGQRLAYYSDETGRNEVYVRSFSESGGKWQVSTDGGFDPRWSADGRELFYRQGDKIMVVAMGTKPVSAAAPRVLFAGAPEPRSETYTEYDVAPDGRRFLMLAEVEPLQAPAQLSVILNWFEDLKRRAAPGKK